MFNFFINNQKQQNKMKKSFFFVAALALTFVACEPKGDVADSFIATFEEAAISPDSTNSEFIMKQDTSVFLKSGNFLVQQTVAYAGSYVTGAVVSNHTDTTFVDNNDAWKSVARGAHAGRNYVVWYHNAWAPESIRLEKAAAVPGMYVCNSVYTYSSITKGDTYAGGPFEDNDWLLLTIKGTKGNEAKGSVEFYLARGKNVVTEWTYVDLSSLGEVDAITFDMTGSRSGDYGLNTPSYFCIDDLGAKK